MRTSGLLARDKNPAPLARGSYLVPPMCRDSYLGGVGFTFGSGRWGFRSSRTLFCFLFDQDYVQRQLFISVVFPG